MPNVLVTSAGRRVELVQLLQEAVRSHEGGGLVVAADAQDLAPALFKADRRVMLPGVRDPRYVDELKSLINEYDIDLVVPTIDPELRVLAHAREEIEEATGAWVMVASSDIVEITGDKLLTQAHVRRAGLLAPEIFESAEAVNDENFPVIIKPRAGSSSIGINVAHTREELSFFMPRTSDPIVQAFVQGEEYTIDCFSDRDGKPVTVVPRLRIATRGGEILKGRIVKDRTIIDTTRALLEKTPMPGHSTVQCFKTSRGIEFIEINARFGGGAPMSIESGADSCKNLLRILDGDSLVYNEDYEDDVVFLRYDQSVRADGMGGVDGE